VTGSLSEVLLPEKWQIAEKMVMLALKEGGEKTAERHQLHQPPPSLWSERLNTLSMY